MKWIFQEMTGFTVNRPLQDGTVRSTVHTLKKERSTAQIWSDGDGTSDLLGLTESNTPCSQFEFESYWSWENLQLSILAISMKNCSHITFSELMYCSGQVDEGFKQPFTHSVPLESLPIRYWYRVSYRITCAIQKDIFLLGFTRIWFDFWNLIEIFGK